MCPRPTCDAGCIPVCAGMSVHNFNSQKARQGLELLPGGAIAYEDEAPAFEALAEGECIPGSQTAGVGFEDLHG